jgi:aryl-alcohol dehydrogenase-like predicted oxidoreductase
MKSKSARELPDTVTIGGALTVSRLGLGTIHLTEQRGFGPARPNAVKLLRRAVELGINFIDTADSYGSGSAEAIVCEALHPYHGITIATKGGFEHPTVDAWNRNGHPGHLRAALEGSLKRLKLEQIPLYYLHVPDPHVPYAESLEAIRELQVEGKIRFVGISNVTSAHVHAARDVLGDTLVSVQNYYNVMFHHGASQHCEDTEDVLDECELREWAFVAWEPLGTAADFPGVDDEEMFRRRALDLMDTVSARHGVTAHVARLAAVLSRSKQLIAIPGTSSLAHLEANMAALKLSAIEDFDAAWLHARKMIRSLREQRAIEDLQRRLVAPVPDYSVSDLPDWRPSAAPTDKGE